MAMEFMQGAPPAAPPPGPDLGALLGAGGAPPEPEPAGGGGSEVDALNLIMEACDNYLGIPTVDESERLIIEKCKTSVQQLKAQNQKMGDEISGANPALRKAFGPA